VDSVGSGYGPVTGSCQHGHELYGSGGTELATFGSLFYDVY
jgi:hypothetical protein